MTSVIELQGISKAFPGIRALDRVELSIDRAEIHGLVGMNGAGKSTLMHILTGMLPPDRGQIVVGDATYSSLSPEEARHLGIAIVPQQLMLVPELSVRENLFCGMIPVGRGGFINWADVDKAARLLLDRVGADIPTGAIVGQLSLVQQQTVAITKALFGQANTIILDEPTAILSKPDIDRLFRFVREHRDNGTSFIYISHALEEVFDLCDRVTVLRDGRTVGTYRVEDLTPPGLIRLMTGDDVRTFKKTAHSVAEEPLLVVRHLRKRGVYDDISFEVRPGEILGLAGLEDSGAAEVIRGLYGLDSIDGGEVELGGRSYVPDSPAHALECGLGYLPRERRKEGLVSIRSIRENVSLSVLGRLLSRLGFLNLDDEASMVSEAVATLDIHAPSLDSEAGFLSGGNQQKVVFAKLVSVRPKVLLMHEPTQGIDVRAKAEILRITAGICAQGLGVVIVSNEVRELLDVCDRIVVLFRGARQNEYVPGDIAVTPAHVLLAMEGAA